MAWRESPLKKSKHQRLRVKTHFKILNTLGSKS